MISVLKSDLKSKFKKNAKMKKFEFKNKEFSKYYKKQMILYLNEVLRETTIVYISVSYDSNVR